MTRITLKDLALILLFIILAYNPPVDHDFGWHYKYGEYIVTNKAILRDNIHSYSMPDYEWTNS